MYKITLDIPDLYCSTCAERLVRRLSRIGHIASTDVSILHHLITLVISRRIATRRLARILARAGHSEATIEVHALPARY